MLFVTVWANLMKLIADHYHQKFDLVMHNQFPNWYLMWQGTEDSRWKS